MSTLTCIIIAGIMFFLLFFIQILVRSKKPLQKTFLGIITGIGSLLAVNISGIFTGVTLPISLLSIAVSAVAGIPGVTTMLILNMIL